jgi:hypothetical protein
MVISHKICVPPIIPPSPLDPIDIDKQSLAGFLAEATALYNDFGPGLLYAQDLILHFFENLMWFHPNYASLVPFLKAEPG